MIKLNAKNVAWIVVCSLILSGCGSSGEGATPTPEPSQAEDFNVVVGATGVVVPEQWAALSMRGQGVVAEVLVEDGDPVVAKQPLVRLDGQAAAEAVVAAAELELVNAQQALDALHENAPLAAAQAELALANSQKALKDEEYRWRVQQKGNRASPETIREAEAKLLLAEDEVTRCKGLYDTASGDSGKALALVKLTEAQRNRDAALRNLNWYKGTPTDRDQAILDGKLSLAQAQLDQAERNFEDFVPGPDPDLQSQAQARLTLAQAQLASAQQALADLELRAPFAGVVCNLKARVGEWLTPGVPVLALGDLAGLHVETTDLNEIDAARIQAGDSAIVTFDALPGASASGTVRRVAFKSAEGSGVNYTVVLGLDQIPDGLRWGMTAFVDIEVGE